MDLAPGGPHPEQDVEQDGNEEGVADAVEHLVGDAAWGGGARFARVGGHANAGGVEEVCQAEHDLVVTVLVLTGQHGVAGKKSVRHTAYLTAQADRLSLVGQDSFLVPEA